MKLFVLLLPLACFASPIYSQQNANEKDSLLFTGVVQREVKTLAEPLSNIEKGIAEITKNLKDKCKEAEGKESKDMPKCIEFDFCDTCCNNKLISTLKGMELKKGDFFTVKIKNVNPYLNTIRVTTKNDTLKAGEPPALFAEFMDIGKLGTIAANLSTAVGNFTANTKEQGVDSLSKGVKVGKKNYEKKINEILNDTNTNLEYANFNFAKPFITMIEDKVDNAIKAETEIKKHVIAIAHEIEMCYAEINNCFTNSYLTILNSQNPCKKVLNCAKVDDCECLKNIKLNIETIQSKKAALIENINTNMTNITDSTIKEELKNLLKALQGEQYNNIYLNKIYSKAFLNYQIAVDYRNTFTYNSFPIQVQGDRLELKIDIIPKTVSKTKEEEKKEEAKVDNKNTNTFSNQSPVTINISNDSKQPSKDNENSKSDADKPKENKYSEDDLKINVFTDVKEYHLNYKFRTNQSFYGYGTGFFADVFENDRYINKPTEPLNPNTSYKIVKESGNKLNWNYGIMATVNGGFYFNEKNDCFLMFFAGPGLAIDTKLKPRLLTGIGLGKGDFNKISFNLGISIGQVNRLSNAFDTDAEYASLQTEIYYTKNGLGFFSSLNYTFGVKK